MNLAPPGRRHLIDAGAPVLQLRQLCDGQHDRARPEVEDGPVAVDAGVRGQPVPPGLLLGPVGGDPLDLAVVSLAAVQCVAAAGAEKHVSARAAAA